MTESRWGEGFDNGYGFGYEDAKWHAFEILQSMGNHSAAEAVIDRWNLGEEEEES